RGNVQWIASFKDCRDARRPLPIHQATTSKMSGPSRVTTVSRHLYSVQNRDAYRGWSCCQSRGNAQMSRLFSHLRAHEPMRRARPSLLILGLLAPLLLSGPAALAQSWPQRTVKFLLPLGPGSGVDIGARLLADRLSARWGQPVVVENRPGGDG